VHLQWRCDLDGVVGAVGVDEDDTACLVSCSCAVAAREGADRVRGGVAVVDAGAL
jgi:hypothetical protein